MYTVYTCVVNTFYIKDVNTFYMKDIPVLYVLGFRPIQWEMLLPQQPTQRESHISQIMMSATNIFKRKHRHKRNMWTRGNRGWLCVR